MAENVSEMERALSGWRTLHEWAKGLELAGEVIRGALEAEKMQQGLDTRVADLHKGIAGLERDKEMAQVQAKETREKLTTQVTQARAKAEGEIAAAEQGAKSKVAAIHSALAEATTVAQEAQRQLQQELTTLRAEKTSLEAEVKRVKESLASLHQTIGAGLR